MITRRMIRRKLLAGWVASAVVLLLVTGLVFAVMLRAAQRDYVRADLAKALSQVEGRLGERGELVRRAAALVAERPEVAATMDRFNAGEEATASAPPDVIEGKRRLAELAYSEARAVGVDALGMFGRDGTTAAVFTSGRASGHALGAGYSAIIDGERRIMPLGGGESWSYRIGLEKMAPPVPPAAPRDRLLLVNTHLALVSEAPILMTSGDGRTQAVGTVLAGRVFGPNDIDDIVARSILRAAFVPEGADMPPEFAGFSPQDVAVPLGEVGRTVAVREVDDHLATAATLALEGGQRVFVILAAHPPNLGEVLSTYGEASVLALLPMALLIIPAGALVLRRWVITPLETLAEAANAVRRGHAAEVHLAERDDEFGQVAGAFNGMVRDLIDRESELRRSVEELSRINGELTQFAYVAAHDLREPVRQIVAYTQFLQRDLDATLSDDQRATMTHVANSALRMYDLIGSLLDYARAERGSGRRAPVDVGHVIAVVQDIMSLKTAEARVSVGPMPTVIGDEVQLVQVFQNLLGNALKFQPPGRPAEVSITAELCREENGGWVFHVRDNGIGFAPEMAERIFAMFERLNAQGNYAGTGIGLPICRKIIEANGGRIWATSTPGEGSTFSFTWPADPQGREA